MISSSRAPARRPPKHVRRVVWIVPSTPWVGMGREVIQASRRHLLNAFVLIGVLTNCARYGTSVVSDAPQSVLQVKELAVVFLMRRECVPLLAECGEIVLKDRERGIPLLCACNERQHLQ